MWWLLWIVGLIILSSIKIVYEYEHGVKFTLGRYSGIMKPGLRLVIPVFQTWQKIQSFNLTHFTNMLLELFNRLSLNFLIVLIDFLKNNHDRLIKLLVK